VAAKLMVQILGEATSAVAAFKKTEGASKEAAGAAKDTQKSFAGIAKGVATGMAVGAVVAFGKTTVKAAQESEVAHQKLLSTFAFLGPGAAAATAGAEAYAESLSKTTGIDDEVISGAQALLATFHSVSGETGRTAGIFDRATAAAADLAAAGFGSIEGNAVQLGKALEDPTKGMAALAKSGVTFTAAQKDQIKAMQQSGDLLGAQKIVLAGVESQVKGTAAATATSSAKMAVAWGNFQESVGAALLPLVDTITQKLTGLFEFVSANSSWLIPLVGGIVALVGGLMVMAKTIQVVKTAIVAFKVAWMLLNMAFAASPIGVIIVGIVALIAVIVLIATKTDWFQRLWKVMSDAMAATAGWIMSAWSAVAGFFAGVFDAILAAVQTVWNWIKDNWPLLLGILLGPMGIAVGLIINYWDQVTAFLAAAWSAVWSAISGVVEGAWAAIQGVWNAMVAVWKSITSTISSIWRSVWAAVTAVINSAAGAISGAFNAIGGVARSVWGWIMGAWGALLGVLTAPFTAAWGIIRGAWSGAAGFFAGIVAAIGGVFSGVIHMIVTPFQTAFAIVTGVVNAALAGIRAAVSAVTSFVTAGINMAKGTYNAFARGWNAIQVSMPEIDTHIPGVGKVGGFTVGLPDLPMLAAGAYVIKPMLAVVGERGREWVLPEQRLAQLMAARPADRQRSGPLVQIATAHFGEAVDVDSFGQRLAWQIESAGM
jgi:phage-related protein